MINAKAMNIKVLISVIIPIVVISCSKNSDLADAYGNFTAKEIVLSSETSGKITECLVTEGEKITQGELLLVTDTTYHHLKKLELLARKDAIEAKISSTGAQIEIYRQQKENLHRDKERIANMLNEGAASQKQFDDIDGQLEVLNKQITAAETNFEGIRAELKATDAGIKQIIDQIDRSKVRAPAEGTILEKYIEKGELAIPGKALLKIADLSKMELKAYVSGSQLSEFHLNDSVRVLVDSESGNMMKFRGTISWISDEAEFTPKNIQTREERVSQVYAVKIIVPNDGTLKINMPAEVYFN